MTEAQHKAGYHCILLGVSPYLVLAILNGFYLPPLFAASPVAFWIIQVMQYWLLPLAILCLFYTKLGIAPGDYGLSAATPGYPAWEMLGAGIFSALLLVIVSTLFWVAGAAFFGHEDFRFSFNEVVPDGKLRPLVVLYLACTAGFVEEVMFRGVVWRAFVEMPFKRYKMPAYVVVSSLVFALVHWEQAAAGMVSSFGFGLVAAMLYLRLRNLWPMIAAHTLVDVYYFW